MPSAIILVILRISKLQIKTLEVKKKMSASPVLGRNARLLKAGVAIGYGKNIATVADAESIKVYSMDSLTPAVYCCWETNFQVVYGTAIY